jgi:creatinine amidohydrolase
MDLSEDLIRSLFGQGFRRFLILNGHGGNEPVRGRLYELANDLAGLKIAWYSWWTSHSVEAIALRHGLKSYHGGWIEAFSFTRVTELPDGEKIPPYMPGLVGADKVRALYGDGVFGGRYQVEEAVMNEIFKATLEDVVGMLEFEET